MKQKEKKKMGSFKKIGMFSLVFLLSIYGLNLGYLSLGGKNTSTFTAKSSVAYDSIEVTGISVRDEKVLDGSKNSNLSYLVQNASKVSQNQPIAKEYGSVNQIVAINRIEQIDKEIQRVTQLSEKFTSSTSQELMTRNIMDSIISLNEQIYLGSYWELPEKKSAVVKNLNERNKILGKQEDYGPKLNALQAEKSQLQKTITSNVKYINSPSSGYFVNYSDGFESQIHMENYQEFGVEKLKSLAQNKEIKSNGASFGKILKGYKWNYIAVVDNRYLERIFVNKPMEILFPSISSESIPFVVKEVKQEEKESIVVFECDTFSEKLVSIRNQPAQLIFKTYQGIQIDKSSLRIQEGQKGVYTLEGGLKTFKKINIIFENENVVICDLNTADGSSLKLYDEVVQ